MNVSQFTEAEQEEIVDMASKISSEMRELKKNTATMTDRNKREALDKFEANNGRYREGVYTDDIQNMTPEKQTAFAEAVYDLVNYMMGFGRQLHPHDHPKRDQMVSGNYYWAGPGFKLFKNGKPFEYSKDEHGYPGVSIAVHELDFKRLIDNPGIDGKPARTGDIAGITVPDDSSAWHYCDEAGLPKIIEKYFVDEQVMGQLQRSVPLAANNGGKAAAKMDGFIPVGVNADTYRATLQKVIADKLNITPDEVDISPKREWDYESFRYEFKIAAPVQAVQASKLAGRENTPK